MDTLPSGNAEIRLKQAFSDFAVFLRKNIYFVCIRMDDIELSFAHYLCYDLKLRILKFKDTYYDVSKRRIMHTYFQAINKLINDVSVKITAKFTLSSLNSILRQSRFSREAYFLYNECIDSLTDFFKYDDTDLDAHNLKWTRDDVLIGSLRNREQLDVCLKHNFYHVPVHCIPDDKMPVNYVALYQSKNFYGEYGGINYYGKVASFAVVSRDEITEIPGKSTSKYYRFQIEKWIKLPETIKISTAGSYFSYTNLYKLFRASHTHELYFESDSETRFYYSLINAISQNKNNVSCTVGDSEVVISSGNILVYHSGAQVYKISVHEFMENKSIGFNKLKKFIR